MTDHRLKMNFALTSFLDGALEDAVQVLNLKLMFLRFY